VLCSKHEPTDVKLLGTGKLQLNQLCKAYGNRILIQSHSTLVTNCTSKDVIPPISLEYDCCGSVEKRSKLNELQLYIPLRNSTISLDDLGVVRHKVEDVENLIREQDWKIKHLTIHSHFHFIPCRNVTTSLTLMCLYGCCSKCCRKRCPKFSKWRKDNNPCTVIVIKPKIAN
jgi:hypothetical protein